MEINGPNSSQDGFAILSVMNRRDQTTPTCYFVFIQFNPTVFLADQHALLDAAIVRHAITVWQLR